jgi:hypothetical protein
MPNGSFDVSYAQSFKELAAREDSQHLTQLRFHLNSGDYFAFLATIFGILEDGLSGKSPQTEDELELIRSIRQDLVYLQQEYRIEPVPIEA